MPVVSSSKPRWSRAAVAGLVLAVGAGAPAAGAATPRPSSVPVCQATGDGSYVLVRVLSSRLQEYRRNPNNLVPAPSGGCPASVGAGTEPAPAPAPTTSLPSTVPATPPPPAAEAPAVKATTTDATATPEPTGTTTDAPAATPERKAASAVKGKRQTGTTSMPSLTPAPAATTTAPTSEAHAGAVRATTTTAVPERLADTGSDALLLALAGATLLLLGAGVLLRTR